MFTQLTELIETHNVFVRERKPTSLRATGIALLYFGLSCRQTAEVLSFSDDASHEAVRQWYHRVQKLLRDPSKRYRPTVAIDETKIKVERQWYFLWAAVDTENGEGTARRGTHADARRARRSPFHQTRAENVQERTPDSARGRRPLVPKGVA